MKLLVKILYMMEGQLNSCGISMTEIAIVLILQLKSSAFYYIRIFFSMHFIFGTLNELVNISLWLLYPIGLG